MVLVVLEWFPTISGAEILIIGILVSLLEVLLVLKAAVVVVVLRWLLAMPLNELVAVSVRVVR